MDENLARPRDIRPLGKKPAIGSKELDAAIFAVGHIHNSSAIHRDSVRNSKLTRAAPRFTPGEKKLAAGRKLVNAGIAVAVTNVDLTGRRERNIGRIVKGRTGANYRSEIHARRPGVRRLAT